jgi:limonene-1,2-epoxide hydrolase
MTQSGKLSTALLVARPTREIEIVNLAVADNVVLTERVDHFVFDAKPVDARVMGTFEASGHHITAWRDHFDSAAHA